MERPTPQHHDQAQAHAHAHALPDESRGQTSHQLKGIRLRKWGSWVSEIRMPKSRAKIWLGSYKTAHQAARAYDAALYCLRGPAAKFNFPDSLPLILPESSLSLQQIQDAAAKHALAELPSISPSMDSNSMEEPAFPAPLQSSSDSEIELSSDDEAFWKSLFAGIDGAGCLKFDKFPSTDESLASRVGPVSELAGELHLCRPDRAVELRRTLTFWWKQEDKTCPLDCVGSVSNLRSLCGPLNTSSMSSVGPLDTEGILRMGYLTEALLCILGCFRIFNIL